MPIDARTYGGGLFGPSIRSGEPTIVTGGREGGVTRPRVATPSPTTRPPVKKPKPKTSTSLQNVVDKFDKALKTPELQVPTLVTPDLAPIPALQLAPIEDYVVAPITLGGVPTLEDIPDQQPVVALDDRQSSSMRRRRQQEIARLKARRGVAATLLSGAAGATGQVRDKLGDTRQVLTRKGV